MAIRAPKFTYREVRYSVDDAMFERARKLFISGNVQNYRRDLAGYMADVVSTQTYSVYVSNRAIDYGSCNCYMGQNDTLCKHMIALGLAALHDAKLVDDIGKTVQAPPSTLQDRKQLVTAGLKKIKGYDGPSSTWFAYQNKLDIGAAMIHEAMLGLEPTKENANFLWDIVKRIDRKLQSHVDDSNGTVWPVASEAVATLANWVNENLELREVIKDFTTHKTSFGYAEELREKIIVIKK